VIAIVTLGHSSRGDNNQRSGYIHVRFAAWLLLLEENAMALAKVAGSLLVAMSVLGCSTAGLRVDGTLEKIKSSNTFNVGYIASVPPFSFPGPDRQPVGYSIDLCKHVANSIQRQLGIKLKLNWVPVTAINRIDQVVQGNVDLECSSTTASLSRQERVDFSLMTFVDGGGLLTKSDRPLRALSDLADKRIAIIPGTTTEAALTQFLKEEFVPIQLLHVKDHVEGRAAVEQGLVEAFASDRGILLGLIVTSAEPSRLAIPNFQFSYEPYGFMLRRNDADFRLAVNRSLAELYRTGGVGQVYERWFGALGKPSAELKAMYLLNGLPE
jgi:ABC-type amino acid transport substrate-binding protein